MITTYGHISLIIHYAKQPVYAICKKIMRKKDAKIIETTAIIFFQLKNFIFY